MAMVEFFKVLGDPDAGFLRLALLGGILASLSFGIMGSYVVAKRIGSLAGAIAHSALGGIGLAIFLQTNYDWTWLTPLLGALLAAVVSALAIGLVTLYAKEREDTIISTIWVAGMSLGIILLKKSEGAGNVDMMSYLLGDMLFLDSSDIWLLGILDLVVIAVGLVFYNKFLAVCFDEEFAELRGVPVRLYYLVLLILIAVSIVLLSRLVGIILVIGLLVLPAATAARFSNRLCSMMAGSVAICVLCVFLGMGFSYSLEIPAGAGIGATAAAIYSIVLLLLAVWSPRASG